MAHKVHYMLNSTHSRTKPFAELQMCSTLSFLLLFFIIGLICHIGKVTVPFPLSLPLSLYKKLPQ